MNASFSWLDQLLAAMKDNGASDLHLVAGQTPRYRIHGELDPINDTTLTDEDLRGHLMPICPPHLVDDYLNSWDVDFAYGLEGIARYRCNYFVQERGAGAVFRIIPEEIIPVDKLGLPVSVAKLAHLDQGLVLFTGPTGSGKSTSLASILNVINQSYAHHIITIEDPIEFVHKPIRSVLSQREIGPDTQSFGAALKAAIREDPDVILVGEMRDLETIALALTAAEMGMLVFGTLHTNNAAKTMDRIIDAFPSEQQQQARAMLAESLRAIVSQLLLRTADGQGRVAVNEVLLRTSALPNLIREGKTGMINSLIQGGKSEGMISMDDSLVSLVMKRVIDRDEAYRKAQNREAFARSIGMKL